jgi:hypothetical protein
MRPLTSRGFGFCRGMSRYAQLFSLVYRDKRERNSYALSAVD